MKCTRRWTFRKQNPVSLLSFYNWATQDIIWTWPNSIKKINKRDRELTFTKSFFSCQTNGWDWLAARNDFEDVPTGATRSQLVWMLGHPEGQRSRIAGISFPLIWANKIGAAAECCGYWPNIKEKKNMAGQPRKHSLRSVSRTHTRVVTQLIINKK